MREYVLFECSECHSLIAYPIETADGRACSKCKGYIIPRTKGTKEGLKELYGNNIIYPRSKDFKF